MLGMLRDEGVALHGKPFRSPPPFRLRKPLVEDCSPPVLGPSSSRHKLPAGRVGRLMTAAAALSRRSRCHHPKEGGYAQGFGRAPQRALQTIDYG